MSGLDVTIILEFEKLFDIERSYDNFSIVRQKENFVQWAVRVRANIQDLLIEKKFSTYHRYCIFASYPGGRLVDYNDFRNYYRPKPLKNGTLSVLGVGR
ncbi:21742_t:CDS:2 [Entrophospora sp. SA101]|nr:21742_t:CDS:2 [Entrophospora sp. SA101]